MRTCIAELHVHTVLSPCAEAEMIPPLIVQEALERGINLIAVTDHNASANVAAVQRAAGAELAVLAGMELQTREEVHLLCIFDSAEQLAGWQSVVDAHLPKRANNAEYFGEQFVVDETGELIRSEPQLLIASADLTLSQAVEGVHARGGLAIPAHVNRPAFSLLANLGFAPADVPFDALEISRHLSLADARTQFPQLGQYPLVQSGDVHRLGEFLGRNVFKVETPTIAELRLALAGQAGRSLSYRSTRIA